MVLRGTNASLSGEFLSSSSPPLWPSTFTSAHAVGGGLFCVLEFGGFFEFQSHVSSRIPLQLSPPYCLPLPSLFFPLLHGTVVLNSCITQHLTALMFLRVWAWPGPQCHLAPCPHPCTHEGVEGFASGHQVSAYNLIMVADQTYCCVFLECVPLITGILRWRGRQQSQGPNEEVWEILNQPLLASRWRGCEQGPRQALKAERGKQTDVPQSLGKNTQSSPLDFCPARSILDLFWVLSLLL